MEDARHKRFYGHGKLLISSEYIVLDGAESLAVPTKKGQWLDVVEEESFRRRIFWKSVAFDEQTWFECYFDHNFNILSTTDIRVAETLQKWLLTAANLNPEWLVGSGDVEVTTKLEFPQNWGLGSSSTLLSAIARWAEVDPYELLWSAFTGSGYDLACATAEGPILYRLERERPRVNSVSWNPSFHDKLYFVHLDKKQKSASEVVRYKDLQFDRESEAKWFTDHNKQLLRIDNLIDFNDWIEQHESRLSSILGMKPVKSEFADFSGALKSLGAWGGDFVLATGTEAIDYFTSRGFKTIVPYKEMVL